MHLLQAMAIGREAKAFHCFLVLYVIRGCQQLLWIFFGHIFSLVFS